MLRVLWNLGVGIEDKGSTRQHGIGKVMHDRFCLEMQVMKHLIRVPMTQEAD